MPWKVDPQKCPEPGCGLKVQYDVILTLKAPKPGERVTKELTCDNNHTNVYTLTYEAEKK